MKDKIIDKLNKLEDILIFSKQEIDIELFQKTIKETQAIRELVLTIPVVVGRSEQFFCECGSTNSSYYGDGEWRTYFCFDCNKEFAK